MVSAQLPQDVLRRIPWLWEDPDMWEFVRSRYSEPHRYYHTLDHIRSMVEQARSWRISEEEGWLDASAMIVFHDIVYDPKAESGVNETNSAILAALRLDGTIFDIEKVVEGIEATTSHESDDPVIRRFLELDMAILASNFRDYHHYARNIRKEYAHVPLEAYIEGRKDFLGNQLDRQIFRVDRYLGAVRAKLLTDRAHHNIASEIGYLTYSPRRYLGE